MVFDRPMLCRIAIAVVPLIVFVSAYFARNRAMRTLTPM